MANVFLDNQMVSATDLNNIAVDLGNSTFANFNDETTYNIDSLNDITKSLMSHGIVWSDNNAMKPTLSDDKINIDTGLCIFSSGAKKRITTSQELTYKANTKQYIYLINDTALNGVFLKCSEENPELIENADYIPIAEYNTDNTLADKRIFAVAKVDLPTSSTAITFKKKLEYPACFTTFTCTKQQWESHKYFAFKLLGTNISDENSNDIIVAGYLKNALYNTEYEFKNSGKHSIYASFYDNGDTVLMHIQATLNYMVVAELLM